MEGLGVLIWILLLGVCVANFIYYTGEVLLMFIKDLYTTK